MSTLILGFGNLDRQDDGVAWWVVNAVRARCGRPPLGEDETGLEVLNGDLDAVFVGQLAPDLLDMAAGYDRLVFVDAHVDAGRAALDLAAVAPAYTASAFTHHMTPGLFVALLELLHSKRPAAHAVSIRGEQFDFDRELSPRTRTLVEPAAERILALIRLPKPRKTSEV